MSAAALVSLLMLAGASWSDLRTRRVRNQYWFPFVVMAGLLWLSDPGDAWMVRAAGSVAMTALAYLLWRVGTFGGADAKALMVLAWLWPGVPDLLAARTVPVLDTLVNATLLAVAMPVLFLLINLIRGDFSFPAALLGTRMPLVHAQRRYVWPMQRVELRDDVEGRDAPVAPPVGAAVPTQATARMTPTEADQTGDAAGHSAAGHSDAGHSAAGHSDAGQSAAGHSANRATSGPVPPDLPPLRWRFWHRPGESLEQTYSGLRAAGVEYVWVTPKIPFMVPLAAAVGATWAWGNLVLRLLTPG